MDAKLNKTQVRSAYRAAAPHYDTWSALTESKARRKCLALAAIRDGEVVLEVAVGTGMLFEQVLKANPNGHNEGIDMTQEMLAQAEARARRSGSTNYALRIGDAYALPYAAASFDVILCNYMFDLLPEKDFAMILAEFARVLRHGGRVVVVSMTRGAAWFNALWDWLYRRWPARLGGCRGITFSAHLAAAGFTNIERHYISQLGFPSEVIRASMP